MPDLGKAARRCGADLARQAFERAQVGEPRLDRVVAAAQCVVLGVRHRRRVLLVVALVVLSDLRFKPRVLGLGLRGTERIDLDLAGVARGHGLLFLRHRRCDANAIRMVMDLAFLRARIIPSASPTKPKVWRAIARFNGEDSPCRSKSRVENSCSSWPRARCSQPPTSPPSRASTPVACPIPWCGRRAPSTN